MYTFQIKQVGPEQIPDIQEIISETWEPAYRDILAPEQIRYMENEIYNTAALQAQIAANQIFFILYVNQAPAGFASYSPLPNYTFKLNKLYVKPSYQGQGFGGFLVRHVEQEARLNGGQKLILNVNRFNAARLRYERLGFAVIAEEDIPIGPYWMNDFIMAKNL